MRDVARVPHLLSLLASVLLLAAPSGAAGTGSAYAEGHIDVGAFGAHQTDTAVDLVTRLLVGEDNGVDTPWSFRAPLAAPVGTWVTSEVTDHSDLGYFVQMRFLGDDGYGLSTTCVVGESDALLSQDLGRVHLTKVCMVPAGTVEILVYANHGADLDVRIVDAPAPA